ncbi:MAG TPA: Uma2 family endonuclease [Isosphaeraceae bacterium]|nr:Uma2 family endonuclease [Isosphaeraceae bacterium]
MSTITTTDPMTTPAGPAPSPAFVPFAGGEQRTVFRGVDWHTYSQLSEAIGEGQHVRLIYDGKDLEIMVTGHVHEHYKELLGTIVKAVTMGREVGVVSCGETTWKTVIRGLEADLSYYFEPEKVRVARAALAHQSTNPADYPRPDLAIEIDMSPPQVDRRAIYADLGVVEVWRLVRGQELIIEQLQADGSYASVEESRFLHIRPEVILQWLNEAANECETTWIRRLFQWAMELGHQA